MPQLVETWRQKGAGSLSLVFILIQGAGCWLVVANQLFSAHDPISVWGPTMVSGVVQLSVFFLAAYYQCTAAGKRASAGALGDDLLERVAPAEVLNVWVEQPSAGRI
eukprot:4614196-Prymnesium_polylepis.1